MNHYEGKEIQVRVICLVLDLNLQALLYWQQKQKKKYFISSKKKHRLKGKNEIKVLRLKDGKKLTCMHCSENHIFTMIPIMCCHII